MSKRLIAVIMLLIIVGGFISTEAWLPPLAAFEVSQGIKKLTESENVSVEVEQTPAILLLSGKIGKVTIAAENAKADKLVIKELHAVLSDIEVDMGTLLTSRTFNARSIRDVNLDLTITQEELSRYLNQSVKGVKNAVVTIKPGHAQVSCIFNVGGILNLAVVLEGKIAADGQKIKFVTERFLLNNTPVGNVGGSTLAQISIVDLKNLPFGVSVRKITMDDGVVIVTADNHAR